jgi:uncharacterized membrane protein
VRVDCSRTRAHGRTSDRGSMSVEATLLAPLLVVIVLFVVHLGRYGTTHLRLVTAADHAARAASLVHPRMMSKVGRGVALDNVSQNGIPCETFQVSVHVGDDTDPAAVRVDLSCVIDRRGLDMLAPLPRRIDVSSTEVIDRWRIDS